MKFKKSVCEEILESRPGDTVEVDGVEGIKLVEVSLWENDDDKYESRFIVFAYGGKHYILDDRRTGSYYTEYWYDHSIWEDEVECPEVKQETKLVEVKEWVRI